MKTFKDLLIELMACHDARIWAADKTIEQVVAECHRGDWMLWLAKKIEIDIRTLTLAKGHCAKTVIHLMKDKRSIDAVNAAIDFGNGKINREQLKVIAYAAAAAAADYAAAYAAAAADYAAYAAAADYAAVYAAADAAAAADYAADAAAAAADYVAAYAAKVENQKQTADICRMYLGELIINKINQLL